MANKKSAARFQYIKFLPLNETQVILCIVTDDGAMDNGLITVPAGMTPAELDYLAGRVSKLLEGRPIAEIDADVLQNVYYEVSHDEVMLHSLQRTLRAIAAKNSEQKVFLVDFILAVLVGGLEVGTGEPACFQAFDAHASGVGERRIAWCVASQQKDALADCACGLGGLDGLQ